MAHVDAVVTEVGGDALALFAVVAALVWLAVWFGTTHLAHDPRYPARPGIAGGTFFEGWQRWDAYWYRAIVRDGYSYYPGDDVQSAVAVSYTHLTLPTIA